MGSGYSTTTYTPEDGQFMAFNNYPLSKSRNRPRSCEEQRIRDEIRVKREIDYEQSRRSISSNRK